MWVILITISKFFHLISKILGIGAGYTWPGHFLLKLYPSIFSKQSIYPKKGLIFISATNGKTTTTKIITHVLAKQEYKVLSNKSGANLLNGILSALILDTDLFGNSRADYGVFEVDEFALPLLLKRTHPAILVLLNLSRDQLDRYGETDIILDKWRAALLEHKSNLHLVLPADYSAFSSLADSAPNGLSYFMPVDKDAAPKSLHSDYNLKNLGAVVSVLSALGVSKKTALSSLSDFELAWGRGETLSYNLCEWQLFLAKNPMSFNVNLDNLLSNITEFKERPLLFILNDNIPDGRDVSWIYDIDRTTLFNACSTNKIYISGTRAYDMAVRLQYADLNVTTENIIPDLNTAVAKLSSNHTNQRVIVLPNYSAMLDMRKILTGRKIL